jgi:hypothetical protein
VSVATPVEETPPVTKGGFTETEDSPRGAAVRARDAVTVFT